MVKLIITGAAGKMGAAIIKCALEDRDCEIAGLMEIKGHHSIGKPSSFVTDKFIFVQDDLEAIIDKGDILIDFTEAKASLENFRIATKHGKGIVIGTTGFSKEALSEINATKGARAVISPNMSIGMNILFDTANKIAGILKEDYDIEIFEMHHRWKKDAPSGTALRIKDSVEAANPSRKWIEVYGREGVTGERKPEEIGVMTLRGGDVVGEHTIYFAGVGERLEITHRAFSRDNFARGALLAAKWILKRSPGIYSMKDVLGL